MKQFVIILFFLTQGLSSYAQNFEGRILYQSTYTSKQATVSDEQWGQMMGTQMQYYIKDGLYRSSTNGTVLQWQVYHPSDNRVYFKMANTVYWKDASINETPVLKVEVRKSTTTILAYSCDEIIVTTKNSLTHYYFNASLTVDPSLFEKFHMDNWYEYLSHTKALPLKTILETSEFKVEIVATEISPMKLDKAFFDLPKDIVFQKSPF